MSENNQNENLHIGIDVGSTTVKLAILDDADQIRYAVYRRHHADVRATIVEVLSEAARDFGDKRMTIAITGSGGLLLAQWLGIEFVQEVIASKTAVETFIPKTDVAIELGGEDAKIVYFDNGIEQRMNGTCAGGTGAFIDQMAALLNTDAGGLNELAQHATTIYPIASRCGVFAKTDVQPLLNEGARREDIAASIFQSVVTQTISGLACGRPIRGYVAFLGGPLQYLPELRKRFYETLNLDEEHRIVPQNAHLFVAGGCAIAGAASETVKAELLSDVLERLKNLGDIQGSEVVRLPPLFSDQAELDGFNARHAGERVPRGDLAGLPRHRLPGHRRRLHHVQGRAHRPGRRAAVDPLRVEQGRRARLREGRHRQTLPRAAARRRRQPAGDHRPLHGHGLRRAPAARGAARGLGRDRDGGAPARRAGDAAGRGVHPGHRRPGHEVPAREGRRRSTTSCSTRRAPRAAAASSRASPAA